MMGYYNGVLQMGHAVLDVWRSMAEWHRGGSPPRASDPPACRYPSPVTHCPDDFTNTLARLQRLRAMPEALCIASRVKAWLNRRISITVWKPLWPAAAGPHPCLWPWALGCVRALTCGVCMAWQTWAFSARPYSRPGNRAEPRSMHSSCKICTLQLWPETVVRGSAAWIKGRPW